jgi:hypothetical protein
MRDLAVPGVADQVDVNISVMKRATGNLLLESGIRHRWLVVQCRVTQATCWHRKELGVSSTTRDP